MKIGIITDIHSNLPAVKAAVAKFKDENCTMILCSGDLIGIGPEPDETVQYLMKLSNFKCIRGNHENYPFFNFDGKMVDDEISFYIWENQALSYDSKKYIQSLPSRLDLEIEGLKITLIHYAMNPDVGYQNFTLNPKNEDLLNMFNGIDSDIIIYGHDHAGNFNRVGNRLFINNGSLGCPMSNVNYGKAGILEINDGKAEYRNIKVEYDVEEVTDKLRKLKLPGVKMLIKIFYGREA